MYCALILPLFLIACDPSYEEFAETFPDQLCDWTDECTSIDGLPGEVAVDDGCSDEALDAIDSLYSDDSCTYDAEAAAGCLETVESAECEDEAALANDCGDVFVGDDCELDLTTLL